MTARRALDVLQDLPSDCCDNHGSDCETQGMVNAAVASIPAGESESSDSATMKLILQTKLDFLWFHPSEYFSMS